MEMVSLESVNSSNIFCKQNSFSESPLGRKHVQFRPFFSLARWFDFHDCTVSHKAQVRWISISNKRELDVPCMIQRDRVCSSLAPFLNVTEIMTGLFVYPGNQCVVGSD